MSLMQQSDLQSLKNDRLLGVARRYFPKVQFSDSYLMGKLLASEADIQRALRVQLVPTQVAPIYASQDELAGYAPAPVLLEPGYDYDPSMFEGTSWGAISTRQKPIISIQSITFNYPQPTDVVFSVPTDWIRPDRKYGLINLVPTENIGSLPLNIFILSMLGGSSNVPFMVQIRYQCGLADARTDFPDAVDLILKQTALNIIDDQYLPQSASVSGDGLSQSIGFDAEKYRDMIENRIERLRQSIQGIRLLVA